MPQAVTLKWCRWKNAFEGEAGRYRPTDFAGLDVCSGAFADQVNHHGGLDQFGDLLGQLDPPVAHRNWLARDNLAAANASVSTLINSGKL